jgi:hypothetical protein
VSANGQARGEPDGQVDPLLREIVRAAETEDAEDIETEFEARNKPLVRARQEPYRPPWVDDAGLAARRAERRIILWGNGWVIAGEVIAPRRWLAATTPAVRGEGANAKPGPVRTLLLQRAAALKTERSGGRPDYVHLGSVRVLSGPDVGSHPYWRVRLSDVSGWALEAALKSEAALFVNE